MGAAPTLLRKTKKNNERGKAFMVNIQRLTPI
jgi:hypothetical protein